jgi:hypothetical protein
MEEILIKQKGSFTHQRFFYRKLSKKSWSKRFFYSSKVLLQKIIEEILIKRFFYTSKVLLQKIIEEILIKKVLLHIKGSFTEKYRRNLDQKGSFTENYWRNLDQKGSFTRQRCFYRKLSKKSWSKKFFYTSKVLLQKIIEEILIKKVLLHIKGSFTENLWRNFDQKGFFTRQRFFYRKLSKKSWSKRFFYLSKVLLQTIIEEILIENELLLHSEYKKNIISLEENIISFNNNFLTWLLSPCYPCRPKS